MHEYIKTENPNYKNENIEGKYLNNIEKKQFLKVKNSILVWEKDFTGLKDRELKDREVKIKREIEELFWKLIIVSFDDLDKFEQKEMKKIMLIKSTLCDWLSNYISDTKRESVGDFKDKGIKLFKTKTDTPKQTMHGRGKN